MTATLAFTALLPIYGGDDAGFFRQAIDSIAASTLAPDTLLICQDGDLPPDLVAAVADAVGTLGARVVHNPGPRGLHHNLNHALRRVTTPWIARCDADDINAPDRFEVQARFLSARPEVGVLGGDLVEFWPDGRTRHKTMPLTHEAIVAWAQWRSPVNHNTVFYRTEAVVGCGGYPNLPFKEDYALWLNLIQRGTIFGNIRADLVRARLGERFYARRAGARNFATEWEIYKIKRGMTRLHGPAAAVALAARSAALASRSVTGLVYRLGLRR